jgi:phage tail-like protein
MATLTDSNWESTERGPLQRGPGTLVDRIAPTGWAPPQGDFAWVFGNDLPGWTAKFMTGDGARIEQTAAVSPARIMRARGYFRGPRAALPTGWAWEAFGGTSSGDLWVVQLTPGSARSVDDLIFSTRSYPGDVRFGIRLTGPGSTVAEIEIPAFYLDDIVGDDAPSDIVVANRSPSPGETNVDRDAVIRFDLIETTGSGEIDLAETQIYVDGVLAYDNGAQPGYTVNVTHVMDGHERFAITLPYDMASVSTVPVVVHAESDLGAKIDEEWSFTIEDYTPPRVVSATAVGEQIVRIVFDEEVLAEDATDSADALNPDNYEFLRLAAPSVSLNAVSISLVSVDTVDVAVDVPMTMGVQYRVIVSNVEDIDENVIEAPYDRADFSGWVCPAPADRRFDLWRMIPRINRDEDVTRDLYKFIAILQEVVNLELCLIDRWTDILDVDIAAERYLDQMLITLGNPFDFDLDVDGKRKLVRILVAIYKLKGTAPGIISTIRFFLGLEVTVEAYTSIGWILGEDLLGESTILGPGTSRERYSFDVIATVFLTDEQRTLIRKLVDYMKPAHTHLINIVEPTIPTVIDHLELGLSSLGETWILH